MIVQWRRFPFFEKELFASAKPASEEPAVLTPNDVKDEENEDSKFGLFDEDFEPIVSHAGRGLLIFGDENGVVRTVTKDGDVFEWNAYDKRVEHMFKLKDSHFLITIGRDLVDSNDLHSDTHSVLKMWRLDGQTDSMTNSLHPVNTFPIFNQKFPAVPISCLTSTENLQQIAVGLGNGAVMFFEGDLSRERNPRRILLCREGPCVTGLHFREANKSDVSLFVVNLNSVTTYYTNRKGRDRIVVDDVGGADLKCSALTDEQQLAVGRTEAVYFYEHEEKGPCYGFEGEKKSITWFGDYLVVVTLAKGATVAHGRHLDRSSLTIYDIKNKFIALQGRFDDVVDVISEWGAVFVVTKDKLYQLREKDLPSKMQMLFKKHLYSIAISLAQSQNCDPTYITEIYQMFGDHLYGKGDHDGAIDQYIETIKIVEPSYVIRKFLDAQRIHNLTRYLQALHHKGEANSDHTTLLLNCFTKLKDVTELDEFIKKKDYDFDIETAIRVCRQAQYYEHALYLAEKHKITTLRLQIVLEDTKDYRSALKIIAALEFFEAESNLKIHGKKLISKLPKETTSLLMKLCTNYSPEAEEKGEHPLTEESNGSIPKKKVKANPSEFIHIFVGKPRRLKQFLEHVVKKTNHSSSVVYNTLLELYFRESLEQLDKDDDDFTFDDDKEDAEEENVAQKIMNLLKNKQAHYDVDHALVLAKMYGFEPGILYLYEKRRLYHEIIQHHMERGDRAKILRACQKYKDSDQTLWLQALTYFANQEVDCTKEIRQVLASIERNNLLPPLMVIQILSKNPNIRLEVIKDYVIKNLQDQNALIISDEREIRNYQEDTEKMREEIEELKTSAKTFQGTKCHACTSALELPAVHFLCMHSYHQRCLVDNDKECPNCAPEFQKVLEMKKSMKSSSDAHDKFFKQLYESRDGFATVAEYFGRGVIN